MVGRKIRHDGENGPCYSKTMNAMIIDRPTKMRFTLEDVRRI
jgi:hypothetical protein